MSDNLNLQNDPQLQAGAGDAPLQAEPTNPTIGGDGQSMAPASPGVVPEQGAPVQGVPPAEPNLGESSTPPNTDEFLNSILQQQPQAAQAGSPDSVAPVSPSAPPVTPEAQIQTEPAPPLNNPLEPQQPAADTLNNPIPMPNEPVMSQPQENQAMMPEQPLQVEPVAPEATTPDAGMQSAQNLQDGISLDSVQSAQPPSQAPQPPAPESPVSSNVFSQPPQGNGGSGMKKMILVLLALIVVGGGYYAYSVFAKGGSTNTPSTPAKTAVASTSKTANQSSNPKDTQRKTDLAVIKDALSSYFSGSNQYPISQELVMLNSAGNILEKELIPNFLVKLPTDPDSTKAYAYKSDGMTFTLSAVLDDNTDPEAVIEGGKAIYQITSASSNPGVSSSAIATPASNTYPPSSSVDDAVTGSSDDLVPPAINSNF